MDEMKMGRPKTKSTTAICGARLVWLALVLELVRGLQGAPAPALYMFGDSQLDVGNNNYMRAGLFKANRPYYGVDYPGHKATGRFSNGRNLADFIAETLGAPSPPAYRSIANTTENFTSIFLKGVNFAYGGAKVSDQKSLVTGERNNMRQQIERDYSSVRAELVRQLGKAQADAHLANSIFVVAVGTTDIVERILLGISSGSGFLPGDEDGDGDYLSLDEFPERLARALERHLQRLYALGMRDVVVVGTGPLGCYPALRLLRESNTTRCSQEVDQVSERYNDEVRRALSRLAHERYLGRHSFVDQYTVLHEYIFKPAANGYADVQEACCDDPRSPRFIPICHQRSKLCPDRRNHLFWDFLHLTDITTQYRDLRGL